MSTRRALLAGGAAAAAALAGAGTWWWRSRVQGPDPYSLSFDTPDGRRLALADWRGRTLLINFWATWCPPCVREMPAIDRFHRDFNAKNWQVLGLAADNADKVRQFLVGTPVSFPIAVAGFGGVQLSRELGNTGGGLPFTVVFDGRGRLQRRHVGETTYELLASWAQGNS